MMKQFFDIRKVDEELRMVWGYASTESVDSQGETVTKAAMEAAWEDYMKFGNVREMHQPSAVGVVKEYSFDDVGVMIGVYVVDDSAWKKVVAGVYKGFSIGGKKLKDGYDALTKTITGLKLTEISLVDRPANPEALITVWKADQLEENDMTGTTKPESHVDALAALLNKGDITPERLVELATADIAKGAQPAEPAAPVAVQAPAIAEPAAPALSPAAQLEAIVKAEQAGTVEKAQAEQTPPDASNTTAQVQVDATPQKTKLHKSVALLMAKGDEIKKGLYEVSSFADLIRLLGWLQESVAYEAAYEGDGSDLPSKIAAAVAALGGLLQEMVMEEVGELVASMKLPDGSGGITMVGDVIANCDMGKDALKMNDAVNVIKAGARNSAADMDRIQKAHDLLAELGAACGQDDTASKLHKAAEGGAIAKALGDFEKLAGEMATLRKSFGDLQTEHTELQKKFDAMPAPTSAVLKVVDKGADLAAPLTEVVQPVTKQDGSIDDIATQIKKIHAGGGSPIFRA